MGRRDPAAAHDSKAEIICIFGKRGSGKSTLAKKLLRGKSRVIVFDPLGEYSGRLVSDPLELFKTIRRAKRFFIVYRPTDARKEFPWIARIAYEIGELCLVAEEISWAISPAKMDPRIEILIRMGRHKGVELIGISRRPAEVNRDLTANAGTIHIFRTTEPRDIKYFRDLLGRDAAERLPRLPEYTSHLWRDAPGKPDKNPYGERLSNTLDDPGKKARS